MVYTLGLNKKIAMKSLKLLSDDLFHKKKYPPAEIGKRIFFS